MRVVDIIHKKRMGEELSENEINFIVRNYAQGGIPDYQMSAWLMAVVWRGLSMAETVALTGAMVASGDQLDLSEVGRPTLDKHSTGGVGDKTTMAVAPILAAGGVAVAKMSGRGLGHTGGTLDKLESIPGTTTERTISEIIEQVKRIGACFCAQTETLVPADRKMYALRDATATVNSMELIASSIMSKKIAGGSQSIILDVKVGVGAFMSTLDDARALAQLMVDIGKMYNRRVVAVLTDMNTPLGFNVGNGIEVREIVELLRNNRGVDTRLRDIVVYLAGVGFYLAGICDSVDSGKQKAETIIISGDAFNKLVEIIDAQGGNTDVLKHPVKQPNARVKLDIRSTQEGYIHNIDALEIGLSAMRLGAGRTNKESAIDPSAGIMLRRQVGQFVEKDMTLATLYASSEVAARQVSSDIINAFKISDRQAAPAPLIYETIGL